MKLVAIILLFATSVVLALLGALHVVPSVQIATFTAGAVAATAAGLLVSAIPGA
jgi:hypothetical protein